LTPIHNRKPTDAAEQRRALRLLTSIPTDARPGLRALDAAVSYCANGAEGDCGHRPEFHLVADLDQAVAGFLFGTRNGF
jgi:hypothetical protein